MANSGEMTPQTAGIMMNHVASLMAEAARLREQAFERAAAGDRTQAANLHEDAGAIASVAASFRYDLADAHADTTEADSLIRTLDSWPF